MTVDIDLRFVGVAKAIRELNLIEPTLRKQFQKEVTTIAQPAVQAVKQAYKFVPLSGMNRSWDGGRSGRKVFPLTVAKAQRGIKVKFDAGRRATANIVIQQMDPGWAVFEAAGRKTQNPLGQSLGNLEPGRTRLIGRVVRANIHLVEYELDKIVRRVLNGTYRKINL